MGIDPESERGSPAYTVSVSPEASDSGSHFAPDLLPVTRATLEEPVFDLYMRAREGQALWNAATDLPWDRPITLTGSRLEIGWAVASQSVYAEQAGLLTAAQLLDDSDDMSMRLVLATAVSDEARHAEVFARYALLTGGSVAPPFEAIEDLWNGLRSLDGPVSRFLVHTILEGLASDEFYLMIEAFRDDLLSSVYENVRRDENRHVAMGIHYLRGHLPSPDSPQERQLREVEDHGLEVAGVHSDGYFDGLAEVTGRPAQEIRGWIVQRHRERMKRVFERR